PGRRAAKVSVAHIVLLPERQAVKKNVPPGYVFAKALKINEKNQVCNGHRFGLLKLVNFFCWREQQSHVKQLRKRMLNFSIKKRKIILKLKFFCIFVIRMTSQTNSISTPMISCRKVEDVSQITLVDIVENSLIAYIKENHLKVDDCLPSEAELAKSLGVARSVLREALSRLKVYGLIESRPRNGMVLREPSIFAPMKKVMQLNIWGEQTMFDILGLRVNLEIGMVDDIFNHLNDKHIEELTKIVNVSKVLENNLYEGISEINFHSKLYEMTGNKAFIMFQDLIHPVIDFIKSNFEVSFKPINKRLKEEGQIVTHSDLLTFLKFRDKEGFRKSLENHFLPYKIFLKERSS
ncbi:MAG: GntR family transcriptional regulator, partial [Bacteroidales bacterium]